MGQIIRSRFVSLKLHVLLKKTVQPISSYFRFTKKTSLLQTAEMSAQWSRLGMLPVIMEGGGVNAHTDQALTSLNMAVCQC